MFFEHWIYLAGLYFSLTETLEKSFKKYVKTKTICSTENAEIVKKKKKSGHSIPSNNIPACVKKGKGYIKEAG